MKGIITYFSKAEISAYLYKSLAFSSSVGSSPVSLIFFSFKAYLSTSAYFSSSNFLSKSGLVILTMNSSEPDSLF